MEPTTGAPRITVVVNGAPRDLSDGATILDVARLCGLDDDERGVAIAHGGAVVPRASWAEVPVVADDVVEVVRATAGG
jgi:thiamine biosynthesis protein ThiS